MTPTTDRATAPRVAGRPRRAGMTAWVAGAVLAAALPAAQAQRPSAAGGEPYPGWDAYVMQALATWKVPGAAIAIVRHDSVIFARGYGVRQVGTTQQVDERTVFAIGSSTKAFTAAAVAMLVDEKKVSLDGRVSLYTPSFQLADAYASREATVRDILSHRSGLARGELVWYGSGFDRDEIVRRVRFLQPTWSFRSQFGYQNIMYIAAGQIVAHVTNGSWDDFVHDRIFVPLGMTSSTTSIRQLAGRPDLASPHAEVDGQVKAIDWRNIDNAGPAGSINSTALDMAKWLRLQLARGSFEGKRLISERMVEEMRTPNTVIPIDTAARRLNPYTHLQAYGLGWFLQDYRGRLVVQHGGNVDGMTALVGMMPEEQIGIVILTNMNGTGMPTALMNRAFDLHLGVAPEDWSAKSYARTQQQRARALAAQQKLEASRVPNTKPSLPLEKYAGTYGDSLLGDVVVRDSAGTLVLAFGPNWRGTLEHWHYDTFRTRFGTPVLGPMFVQFHLSPMGTVDELQTDLAGPATFRRRPEQSASARAAP
jgi:CubicO group peptidase (beta-lactamase class C family)